MDRNYIVARSVKNDIYVAKVKDIKDDEIAALITDENGKDYMYKKVTIKKEDLLNYEFFSDYRSAYFFYLKKYFMQK